MKAIMAMAAALVMTGCATANNPALRALDLNADGEVNPAPILAQAAGIERAERAPDETTVVYSAPDKLEPGAKIQRRTTHTYLDEVAVEDAFRREQDQTQELIQKILSNPELRKNLLKAAAGAAL